MARWALMAGGVAFQIVEGDKPPGVADWREVGATVQVGYALTGETWAAPGPVLSPQQFRDLFTAEELTAIVASEDAGVRILLLKLSTRSDVPMRHPSVIAGLDHLVSVGLLTPQRRAVIGG